MTTAQRQAKLKILAGLKKELRHLRANTKLHLTLNDPESLSFLNLRDPDAPDKGDIDCIIIGYQQSIKKLKDHQLKNKAKTNE